MFLGKVITVVRPSLMRSLMACPLLLSAIALAGTHEGAVKPNKNTDVSAKELAHNETHTLAEKAPAKTTENVLRTPSASAIRSIKVSKDYKRGGMLLATIELDGQPQYTHFTLPSPYRLVIDVQNVATDVPNVIQVGLAEIKRVRLGKMDDAVRIVFDATKPQPYEISDEGDMIRIWFGESKTDPTLALKNSRLNDVSANSKASLTTPTTPARPVLKPAPTSVATENVRTAPPSQTKPVVAEAAKQNSAPTIHQPKVTPALAQLPTMPKLSAHAIKPRVTVSLLPLRKPPVTNLSAKVLDAPLPRRTKASLREAAQVQPALPKPMVPPSATTTTAAKPAPTKELQAKGSKRGGRVVTATPVALTTPPASAPVSKTEAKNSTPVSTPKVTPEKVTPESVTRTEPEKTTPAVVPPPAPVVPTPTPRPRETAPQQNKSFNAADYVRPDFVGEPINLDLRSTQGKVVDIRDFLRFISDTYKVNFVIDQSVKDTPITVTLQNVPWNQAMDALLRANRLGVQVEGSILRVMSQETVALEDRIRQEQVRARQEATPLVTEMVRLNYARALTGAAPGAGGGGGGGGSASGGGGGGGGSTSGASSTAGGSGLDGIIRTRLSQRGNIQADPRTNTLIITDLPENIAAIKEIIAKLDVPEPQVEIESRIVIANRNFARDLGVQIGATALNGTSGSRTTFSTLPGSATVPAGGEPTDSLRAAGAASILSLTTGLIGTARISAVLSAAESKGNVKTISSPRATAQNNTTANIVNGVQIPVQTESNNTLTVTFVTAALRLEITPQINDNGYVLLKVVAENNSVNTAIATRSAPGINTQRAETTVLVPDGGTTIIGGINIDVESNSQQRTPGISRVPGLGELFKRRTVSRQTDEILFFITPRIYRPLNAPTMTTQSLQK